MRNNIVDALLLMQHSTAEVEALDVKRVGGGDGQPNGIGRVGALTSLGALSSVVVATKHGEGVTSKERDSKAGVAGGDSPTVGLVDRLLVGDKHGANEAVCPCQQIGCTNAPILVREGNDGDAGAIAEGCCWATCRLGDAGLGKAAGDDGTNFLGETAALLPLSCPCRAAEDPFPRNDLRP